MKKIVTAFLCALLLSALPVLAAQPDALPSAASETSTAHALPTVGDVSTDLKLQQQKLEFFKERLQIQDERIVDLGLMIGFFGILVTAVVLVVTIRATREAVHTAKEEAQKEFQRQAEKYVGETLRPIAEKEIEDIKKAGNDQIRALEKTHQETQSLNEKHRSLNKEQEERLAKFAARTLNQPSTPAQQRDMENAVQDLASVPPKDYRFKDWNLLGIQAFEQGKPALALEYFSKAGEIAETPVDKARALLNKGITLSQLQRSEEEIAAYDEMVKRYGDAPEAALREPVAKALANKGVTLGQLQRSEEAIVLFDEVVKRYGEAPEAALREQVAKVRALKDKIQSDRPD